MRARGKKKTSFQQRRKKRNRRIKAPVLGVAAAVLSRPGPIAEAQPSGDLPASSDVQPSTPPVASAEVPASAQPVASAEVPPSAQPVASAEVPASVQPVACAEPEPMIVEESDVFTEVELDIGELLELDPSDLVPCEPPSLQVSDEDVVTQIEELEVIGAPQRSKAPAQSITPPVAPAITRAKTRTIAPASAPAAVAAVPPPPPSPAPGPASITTFEDFVAELRSEALLEPPKSSPKSSANSSPKRPPPPPRRTLPPPPPPLPPRRAPATERTAEPRRPSGAQMIPVPTAPWEYGSPLSTLQLEEVMSNLDLADVAPPPAPKRAPKRGRLTFQRPPRRRTASPEATRTASKTQVLLVCVSLAIAVIAGLGAGKYFLGSSEPVAVTASR